MSWLIWVWLHLGRCDVYRICIHWAPPPSGNHSIKASKQGVKSTKSGFMGTKMSTMYSFHSLSLPSISRAFKAQCLWTSTLVHCGRLWSMSWSLWKEGVLESLPAYSGFSLEVSCSISTVCVAVYCPLGNCTLAKYTRYYYITTDLLYIPVSPIASKRRIRKEMDHISPWNASCVGLSLSFLRKQVENNPFSPRLAFEYAVAVLNCVHDTMLCNECYRILHHRDVVIGDRAFVGV